MRLSIGIFLACCAPLLLAFQFIAPADGAVFTGDSVLVNFSWDAQPVLFSLTGQQPIEIDATSTSVPLSPGSYTATISNNTTNESAQASFSVVAQPQTNISVSTDQQVYEVLSSARIRVTVSSPSQLSLQVSRGGQVVDSYTLNVQQQTDFLYTLQAVGSYTVTVSLAGSPVATTSFTAQNTTLGVSINGPSTATAGRVASFTSTVTGGTAPYTYLWQFSDNTTSAQANADHVFSQAGNYTVRLVVQDSQQRQASANTTIAVYEQTYKLTVTVLGDNSRLLKDALVTLSDNRSTGRTDDTDAFGEAKFRSLSTGNYTLNVSYNETALPGQSLYTSTQSIAITADQSVSVKLPVPDVTASPSQNNSNQSNNSQKIAPAPVAAQPAAVSQPEPQSVAGEEPSAAAKSAVGTPALTPEELEARADLERARSEKLDALANRLSTFSLNDEKQKMVSLIGLTGSFDSARSSLQSATSKEQIEAIFATIPKDVIVMTKDTTISTPTDDEVERDLERFFAARAITERSEKNRYKYSIEQAVPQTSITAKRSLVRVIAADGTIAKTYTVFSRTMKAPGATTFVEFIPKSIAKDASQLRVDGSHEVLEADPVIRFLSTSYAYYVEGDADDSESPSVLPVPFELTDPPSFIGLVSVKLNLDSFERGGLYAALLGCLLGAAVIGNIVLRKQTNSSMPAFMQLSELMISSAQQENLDTVAKYAEELKSLHSTLSPVEQKQTADIVGFVSDACAIKEFRSSVASLRGIIALGDVNAVGAAYERVMSHYEALGANSQAREQQLFDAINQEVDTFVTSGTYTEELSQQTKHIVEN